jgi:hypothetical protein
MRQLLSDRAPMRIPQDRAVFEACVLQYGVQVGRERRHVVRPGQVAAVPVAAKIGNDHAEIALKQRDQRVEHCAGGHEAVEQEQRVTIARDFVE